MTKAVDGWRASFDSQQDSVCSTACNRDSRITSHHTGVCSRSFAPAYVRTMSSGSTCYNSSQCQCSNFRVFDHVTVTEARGRDGHSVDYQYPSSGTSIIPLLCQSYGRTPNCSHNRLQQRTLSSFTRLEGGSKKHLSLLVLG